MTTSVESEAFAACAAAYSWRRHQAEALAAIEAERSRSDLNHYVVLPPGAGKTQVGLEAARRLGRRTLVLGPNSAIQSQWVAAWRAFEPSTVEVTTDRSLPTPVTVLTYQALAVFDPDAEVDEEGRAVRAQTLLDRLHPNGRDLVDRLRATGPWTLVLDECHHLLDVWGRLLLEVLEHIGGGHDQADVAVLGLTATPPTRLTRDEYEIVQTLFGDVTYEASTPGGVREGYLAPYQELVHLTVPTPTERDYIHGESERFAEFVTDLMAPDFASTSFLSWCEDRFVTRRVGRSGGSVAPVSWARLERDEPDLAAAALRLHHAGLLALPDGARIREQYRHPPEADDWAVLVGDYVHHCLAPSDDPADASAYEAIRRALPAIGYQLTRRGVRAGRSPVDRVLARSAAKASATVEILDTEHADLGEQLRAVVVCDHEQAAARLDARLAGVLDEQAGSARLLLETLVADARTRALRPVLMTAKTVACARSDAGNLVGWLRERDPALDLDDIDAAAGSPDDIVTVTGRWSARRWVPLLTRFFESGGCQVLVGTRGLLGEGWDARSISTVVDLTTATTATAVVQTRGRGIRTDPERPDKVANTWSVVAVAPEHPKGATDYERFVAKHDGFYAVDADGVIASGVAHVDPELSPYGPPAEAEFDRLNARMQVRAAERDRVRAAWRVGEPYEDVAHVTLRVRSGRRLGLTGSAVASAVRPWRHLQPVAAGIGAGCGALAGPIVGALADAGALLVAMVAIAAVIGAVVAQSLVVGLRLRRAGDTALHDVAAAVAAALHELGELPVGPDAVRVRVGADGTYRADLDGVTTQQSAEFMAALDEVLSPVGDTRYVVRRLILDRPASGLRAVTYGLRRTLGLGVGAAEVWHAVPATLATNKRRARCFARQWERYVGPTRLVYTRSPEGEGLLAAQRGGDPFAMTTALRTVWR